MKKTFLKLFYETRFLNLLQNITTSVAYTSARRHILYITPELCIRVSKITIFGTGNNSFCFYNQIGFSLTLFLIMSLIMDFLQ